MSITIFNEKLRLSIDNCILKADNEVLIKGQKATRITANAVSGATTITVANFNGIADNDYLLLGNFGEPTAEIVQVDGTPTSETITVSALGFDHYADTPVTVIPFNKIQFYRAETKGGSKTQLGSDVDIMAYSQKTSYFDETNTTGYGSFRFMNEEDTEYSEYSDEVDYEGNAYNSVETIITEAVNSIGIKIGDKHAKEQQLLLDANEAQNIITRMQDWIFELVKNDTSIATTENENKYALSGLTYAMKYADSKQGIKSVRIANDILDYYDINEYEESFEGVAETTLSETATVGATSITLTDSYEFNESGTIYLGGDTITYTANNESTGVLSGISASGSGSITTEMASGSSVWQGVSPGVPTKYTIFDGYIYLNKPVETDEVGKKLKFKYLKALTRFTDYSDVIAIPFYEAISKYISFKIEKRRGNKEDALYYKAEFDEIVKINGNAYKLPIMEVYKYYNFNSDG